MLNALSICLFSSFASYPLAFTWNQIMNRNSDGCLKQNKIKCLNSAQPSIASYAWKIKAR